MEMQNEKSGKTSMEHNHKNMPAMKEHNKMYNKLLLMTVLSLIAMYFFMYSMINSLDNFYHNVNMFYMAGLMAMPMVIFEVIIMRSMYMNKKRNAIIIGASLIALFGFFLFIRWQTAVGDREFVKGMIPHHAAAILMAKKANIHDPEIKKLAEEIITSQEKEIQQMKAFLNKTGN